MVENILELLLKESVLYELLQKCRYYRFKDNVLIFYGIYQKPKFTVIKNRLPVKNINFNNNRLLIEFKKNYR